MNEPKMSASIRRHAVGASMFMTALLLLTGAASAQTTNDFATGNMHFDAHDMDTNHDGKISKDEMMEYGSKLWGMMAKDSPSISVKDAAKDFAQGNLRFDARAMDTDHDGTITKDEFMKYTERKFDKMKGADGMVSVADASVAFSQGNRPDSKKSPK
ncbi:MAG TPA: EF-hand domain-containing protein [Steroidobacteraceae bacterium]|nr:EF-hand domain-containing protein [Steroidobacteraceae bacterium]